MDNKELKTYVYRQIGGIYGISDTKEVESRNPEDVDLTFTYTLTPLHAGDPAPVVKEEVDLFYFLNKDKDGNWYNVSGTYYPRGTKLSIEESIEEIERLKENGIISDSDYERGIHRAKRLGERGTRWLIIQEPSEEKKKSFNVIEAKEEDQTLEDLRKEQKIK